CLPSSRQSRSSSRRSCSRRWTREPSDASARLQPALLHAPEQMVDAVLSEERLTFEDEERDAPVACGVFGGFVGLDDRIETSGISGGVLFQVGETGGV